VGAEIRSLVGAHGRAPYIHQFLNAM
jgi:hypothetical protein